MKTKFLTLTVLTLLLMAGCQSESLDSVDDSAALSESIEANKGIGNAPEASGPYLIRFEFTIGIIIVDLEKGITATFGGDNPAFCADEPDAFDLAPVHWFNSPSDEDRFIALQQGEIITTVYDGVPSGGPICDFFTSAPILAEGMSHFLYRNNDFYGSGGNNANSYSGHFNGQLEDSSGERVNISAMFKVMNNANKLIVFDSLKLN